MNNYIVIKLDNGNKYISIDYIDYLNNKYFLLSKIDENNNILQYGPIHSLKYELIKIIRKDQEYYLQRYFG